ncbi:sensor histidine kinase [Salinimonas lutimaris]|uniref:sensor histidine kinase n=1 Tax=Salinimonas lutimaris TaxID=914153 RepID=UPI0010C0582B|nr:HAMP domain-containing sensor histidine kinase [Salinimonas lutimaris]
MSDISTRLSIRSLFLWVIMAIVTIILVLATGLSVYMQISSSKNALFGSVTSVTRLVSNLAASDISAGNSSQAENILASFAQADNILHAHAFWSDPRQLDDLTFLASFNQPGQPAITPEPDKLDRLSQPVLHDGIVEYALPVMLNHTYVGYIYVQASADTFNRQVGKSILLHLSIMFVLLLLTYLFGVRLQRLFIRPIEQLSAFVQHTSRQRNYRARAPGSSVQEVDVLCSAVNLLLSRMQDYVATQKQVEQKHKALNTQLEDIVNQRTLALKDANHELLQTLEKLHQYQRQVIENEKLASLGDLITGVAHEMNTPLGLSITATSVIVDRLGQLQQEFNDNSLKASQLEAFLQETQESLAIVCRNLDRTAELINSFKQLAVDQNSETNRTFCVLQLFNEILLPLRPQLKKHHHNINITCDPTLIVETKAGPINQILINLIMNSVVHGFENRENGQIDIKAELASANTLRLVYKDDGKGIPAHIRQRIYDPFVTTRLGHGGSGLGMHLVYNLVTQVLNGTITLLNEENSGVEFVIVFPVESAKSEETVN